MNAPSGIRSVAARGAAVTVVSQAARMVVQLLALVVLARLLDPSIFGQMAIVLVVVGIGETLRELGLSSAAIHAKSLTQRQQSNLFWINAIAGFILFLAVYLTAGLVAAFYVNTELVDTLQAVGGVFIINGLASQHRAMLARRMKFINLALSELLAITVGLTVAIILAGQGAGVGALVAQQVVQSCVICIAAVFSAKWFPSLPGRAPMGALLRYGGNLGLTQLINYAARNFDTILLGRIVSTSTLGYYNRSFQLVMLPVTQINAPATKVAFPILARLQDDPARFLRYLRSGQSSLVHSVIAVLLLGVAVANPAITIFLGGQWQPSVVLFQVLAFAGIFQTASYPMYWVFLARGLTGSNLRYTLVTKAVLVIAILIGSNWGVTGVAIAFSAASFIAWPIGLRWMYKAAGIPWRAFGGPVAAGLPVYCTAAATAAIAVHSIGKSSVAGLAAGLVVYAAVVLLSFFTVKAYRKDIRDLASIIPDLRNQRKIEPVTK